MENNLNEIRERLYENVRKLSLNEQNLSKEELLSDKYKVAYTRLKEQIKKDMADYVQYTVFCIRVPETKVDEIKQRFKDFGITTGIGKDAGSAIYKEYNVEKLESICEAYNQRCYNIIADILEISQEAE